MTTFFKDKKNIIILLLTALIIILITFLILAFNYNKSNVNVDGSNMSYDELIHMFEKEGYIFKLRKLDTTLYITLENNKKGITIQRIPDTLVGTLMTFEDNSINYEMANLLDTNENNTKEKKQQYEAFLSWLNYYNISKIQLCSMLDNYYTNNVDKIEYIDTTNLLKNN